MNGGQLLLHRNNLLRPQRKYYDSGWQGLASTIYGFDVKKRWFLADPRRNNISNAAARIRFFTETDLIAVAEYIRLGSDKEYTFKANSWKYV